MSSFVNEQFASSFDGEELQIWIQKYWPKTIILSALYFVLIFAGQHWMAKRERFDLRWSLTLWSGSLAVFSILGTWATWQQIYQDVRSNGFHFTLCDNGFYYKEVALWLYVFCLSKVVELGDTLFIVARKQKLIFLHWYHHIATLLYAWYGYGTGASTALYCASMNFTVHSLMYSYYALRASKLVRIPKQVNILITSLQLLQMVFGVFCNVYAYNEYANERHCAMNWNHLFFGFVMYASYVVLFANFFWHSYLSKPKDDLKLKAP